MCLRGTDEYVRARTEPLWPPLLDGEAEQLARGDIPYFFRFLGRPGIHYYADPEARPPPPRCRRAATSRSSSRSCPSRAALRAPSRKSLREQGLFTVLGAFDHPALRGRHEADDLAVTFQRRTLVVHLPGGEELETAAT